jgi:hypothetical protein
MRAGFCRSALAVLAGAAAASMSAAPLNAATLYNFHVDNWFAGAYTNDTTHDFSHCAASVKYNSGILLLFSIGRGYDWSLGLADPDWSLTPGQVYDIVLSIDRTVAMRARARAINTQQVSVPLADSAALFRRFRWGRQLTIYTVGRQFAFNLTDTSRILPALGRCVAYNNANPPAPPVTSANPFTSEPQGRPSEAPGANTAAPPPRPPAPATPVATPAAPAAPPSDHHAEAATLLANILSAAGIGGFRLLGPGDLPHGVTADAAWRAGSLVGALSIVTRAYAKPQDLAPYLIAIDAKNCGGTFASGILPEKASDAAGSVRVFTSCQNGGPAATVYYAVFARPAGGFYVLSTLQTGTAANEPSSEEVNGRISAAAVRALAH